MSKLPVQVRQRTNHAIGMPPLSNTRRCLLLEQAETVVEYATTIDVTKAPADGSSSVWRTKAAATSKAPPTLGPDLLRRPAKRLGPETHHAIAALSGDLRVVNASEY